MSNKILTISVAAYNVKKTLSKTLDSFNDSRIYDDVEVLIIDDGSKDKTKDIAEKYEKLVPQMFKYIKKSNGGHGSTINKGITLATGKYFKVIDGDDWVDTDSLIKFVEKLKNMNSDLVLTNHTEVYPNHTMKVCLVHDLVDGKTYTWNDKFDIKRVTLHTLTIKTRLLQQNKVHITENCFYVDVEYVIWSIYLAHTITYLDIYLYMYRLGNNNQSVSKMNMLKNVNMQEKVSYQLVKLYDQFNQKSNMSINQDDTIFNTFKRSIGSTMRTYLLLDTQSARLHIINFDKNISNISRMSFNKLNEDKFIKFLRLDNYFMIPFIRALYKFWLLKYAYLDK